MCISLKKHFATEKRPVAWCIQAFPERKAIMSCLMNSVSMYLPLREDSTIFEIGCAQGLSLFALKELGYRSVSGLEPSSEAMAASTKLSQKLGLEIQTFTGIGERLPLKTNSVDFIFAQSVMEHVTDDIKVFKECYRVLKKGGGFYFSSTSIACPAQSEIRYFPFFSWYPDRLKKRIMLWCVSKWPSLVGYTDSPALNWYSWRRVRKTAREIGYRKLINRWELAAPDSGTGGVKHLVKYFICKYRGLRYLASVIFQGSEYLLIK